MAINIGAPLDAAGNVEVNLPLTESEAGYATLLTEVDGGDVLGTRTLKAPEVTEDYRFRVGLDTPLLSEQFPGAALNTTLWSQQTTTMTITVANGFLNLNAGSSVATTVNARVMSYQHFPIYGSGTLYGQFQIQFPQTPVTNNVCEWGFGIATGTSAPTDGAFFRLLANGEFRAVLNWNGTETQSGTLNFASLVGTSTTRDFIVEVTHAAANFWIDDDLVAVIPIPVGQGSPTNSPNLPILLRCYNSGVTSVAQQMKVGNIDVSLGDFHSSRPWADTQTIAGRHASQGQTGQTLGTTANYANSANPTAAVPTNTTAALGSGLGGQFWETASLAVNTDGIISSYQNPAGTATAPGRNLVITGVKVQSYIQTVIAGGPFVAQWSLAYGHTAVSLATAEGAGTKAARRVPIGTQLVTTAQAVSTLVTGDVVARFDAPIVVYPGEFIQTVTKHVGTVGTTGTIAHIVTFDGYWE